MSDDELELFDENGEPTWRRREGRKRRDAGAERVESNTPDWWKAAFDDALSQLVSSGEEFTAEDIRPLCGDPPNHPNAFSARVLRAVRKKSIVWTGKISRSKRPTSHAALLPVYLGPQGEGGNGPQGNPAPRPDMSGSGPSNEAAKADVLEEVLA